MNIKERELEVTEDKHPVVEQMEKEWPVMTKEFKRLQRQQYELFLKKQHDYGPGTIYILEGERLLY